MFRTPKDTPKRNYDDFEILERASFHSEGGESSSTTTSKDISPKATASAQIHVKIADKRSLKENEPVKSATNDVDDTLKKLLIMLIKPLVENNGPGRVNPFFPFPPSPHPSPPYSNLLGSLSALSAIAGTANNPEAVKKAAKMIHKFKEQIKASTVDNEIEDVKKKKSNIEEIPLKISLNDKPMKLQMEDVEENASVAGKSEKLVDLAKLYPLLLAKGVEETEEELEEEEEKPKRKKKKPKMKAVDPFEVYMRRIFSTGNNQLFGGFCNCNPLLNTGYGCTANPLRPYDLSALFTPKYPKIIPTIPTSTQRSEILATEFVVHVPVLIKNKPTPYNSLANYPLLAALLANYGVTI